MALLSKSQRLKKELSLLDVYAIATGTTLSGGLFLLPGLAFAEAGPAMILAYLLVAVPLIPAMLSKVELATAMPRSGGVYYILDRALGPLVGTIGGIGVWMVLVLKAAFALIGMGAYIELFATGLTMTPIAILLALILGGINLLGAKKTGGFQVALVVGILTILIGFIAGGLPQVEFSYFENFFQAGIEPLLATTGLVYISFVGVMKVVSLAEEVKKPERNIPLGIFLALGTAFLIYALGTFVMVGVIPAEQLNGDLTPVATAAESFFGSFGVIFVSAAALMAFISVANVGILSASRYPLAMSRDNILPSFFQHLNKRQTPSYSLFVTVGTIVAILFLLDPLKIAKLASAFQLLIFAVVCLAVIIMRESMLDSYDPSYRDPFYPWTQIIGIVSSLVLIVEMGWVPIVFSTVLVVVAIGWYFHYVRSRVTRTGAIYHLFARLGERRFEGLDQELRSIMKEKGLREEDPFDEVVARAFVIDLSSDWTYEQVVEQVSDKLSQRLPVSAEELKEQFTAGSQFGSTPVAHGAALPHLRLANIENSEMVLVRSSPESYVLGDGEAMEGPLPDYLTYAFFFLVSPDNNPGQHLRILAQIAGRVDDEHFMSEWLAATDDEELKETLLRDKRFLSLRLNAKNKSAPLIGHMIQEIAIPEGCLITLIRRGNQFIIPKGSTVLQEGDRLTIIGTPEGIQRLYRRYEEGKRSKAQEAYEQTLQDRDRVDLIDEI